MSYNMRDYRERPPMRRGPIIITASISVAITLSLVLTIVLIFENRLSSGPSGGLPTPPLATSSQGITQPAVTSQPVNCNERKQTGVGNTATYSFTVSDGCVAVVTGVNITGIPNPWSDGGGGIEGLQPGSYTVTILDGSYQISTTTAGQAVWCNIFKWEQQNGKADTYNYPIDGWTSNCP